MSLDNINKTIKIMNKVRKIEEGIKEYRQYNNNKLLNSNNLINWKYSNINDNNINTISNNNINTIKNNDNTKSHLNNNNSRSKLLLLNS